MLKGVSTVTIYLRYINCYSFFHKIIKFYHSFHIEIKFMYLKSAVQKNSETVK